MDENGRAWADNAAPGTLPPGRLTLAQLVAILYRGWRVILSVTVAVVLLAALGLWLAANWRPGSQGQVQTGVGVNHPSALAGLAPNGKSFEINDLRAAGVLQAAVEMAALPKAPSLDALASAISIQAVANDAVAIDNLLLEQAGLMEDLAALHQETAAPTRFIVRLEVWDALGLTVDEARALLDAIIYQYRLAWAEKYSGYKPLANISIQQGLSERYDYIQTAALLDEQAQSLQSYTRLHLPDDAFRSAATGLGRPELLTLLEDLEGTGTQALYTHIFSHALTKDTDGFVALCGKLADSAGLAAEQGRSEALALRSALQATDDGNAADELMRQFMEAGVQAEKWAAEAVFYRQQAEQMRRAAITAGPGSDAAAYAETLIDSTAAQLAVLTPLVNDTVRDYYLDSMEADGVMQLFPTGSYTGAQDGGSNTGLALAIALGTGLVLGVLVVLFRAYMPARKSKRGEAGK